MVKWIPMLGRANFPDAGSPGAGARDGGSP